MTQTMNAALSDYFYFDTIGEFATLALGKRLNSHLDPEK